MAYWVIQFLWSGILAFGIQFLYVGIRVRFDRNYIRFGCVLILMAALLAGVVWPGPDPDHGRGTPPGTFSMALLIGAGLFTIAGVYFLMQRFLSLHRANRDSLRRLGDAYAGLRESARYKELGASAASISHEIRNYAATLKGNAILLGRDPDPSGWREEVERIQHTAQRLETISRDIALYSRSSLSSVKRGLALDDLIRECVRRHFRDRAAAIGIGPYPPGARVDADAEMLPQVFFNLFKNALEAGARGIAVRFLALGHRLVVAVEDDGSGCAHEDVRRIAVPFFTSKSETGTGLGCSIAEAILADHRASFRAYTKNALAGSGTGLVVNMVFPLRPEADADAAGAAGDILVVSGNPEARADLIAPMIHLGLHPVLIDAAMPPGLLPTDRSPICIEAQAAHRPRPEWGGRQVISVDRFRHASVLGGGVPEGAPFLFSEENLAALVRGRAR
jgi:signal transduction histidine kinase